MLLSALLLGAAALAGDGPHRCEAALVGPVDRCELRQSLNTTGTGRSEAQARKNAVSRLEALVALAAEARVAQAAGPTGEALVRPQVAGCKAAVAEHARVYCYPEPALEEQRLCFADLDDRQCWRSVAIDREGTGWKTMEQVREQLCEQVDSTLAAEEADESRRRECQMRCLQQASVRCTEALSSN